MNNIKNENIQDKKVGEDMPEELKLQNKEEKSKENSQAENDSAKARFKGLSMKNVVADELVEDDVESKKETKLEGIEQPTDHLSRMRLQMLAQKQLDKGLMEKEAKKIQTKEAIDKLNSFENASENDEQDKVYDELDKLKEKISQLEKENEEYKEKIEKAKNNKSNDAEIKKENIRLEKANQKLLEDKKNTTENYNSKINELQKLYKESNNSNVKLEAKQERLVLENTNLKENLQSKNKELSKLKKQVESLEEKAKKVKETLDSSNDAKQQKLLNENSNLKEDLQNKNKELSKLKKQVENLEIKSAKFKEEVSNMNDAKQEKVLAENSNLKEDLQNKNKELNKLKKQIEVLENKNTNEIISAKLENENVNLKNDLVVKETEIKELKKQLEVLTTTNNKKEIVNPELVEENKNLKKEISLKEKEISKIQKQVGLLEEKVQLANEMKKNLSSKEKENAKLLAYKEKINNDVKDKKKEISLLNRQIKKNEKSLETLTLFKKDNTTLVKKLSNENDKLVKANNELNESISSLKEKNSKKIIELNYGYTNSINERLDFEEKLAISLKEKNNEVSLLNERIEELNVQFENEKTEIEQNYVLQLEERLNNENNLAKSLSENKKIIEEQKLRIEELEKMLSEKELIIEKESKETSSLDLNENEMRMKDELDLLKQREAINLRRNSVFEENNCVDITDSLRNDIISCEKQLNEIKDKVELLDESAILDPEFKKKIRSIREMKSELLNGIEIEKKQFSNNFNELAEKINIKNKEIKLVIKKVENIDSEYEGTSNRTSLVREQYTSKRSKALIELEALKSNCLLLEDEYRNLRMKYNSFNETNNRKLESINNAEMDIINYYLEQLKSDLLKNDNEYLEKQAERDVLVKKLNESKSQEEYQDKNIIELENVNKLEQQIKSLDSDYNQLLNKVNILKEKQEERLASQRKVEEVDKYIRMYIHLNEDLENFIKHQRENETILNDYRNELNSIDSGEHSKTIKLRAKIQDIIITQNDLQRKIEDAKYRLGELTNNGRVRYYIDLLRSMEDLNEKYRLICSQMESIKQEIADKNKKILEIKNKIKEQNN